MGNVLAGMGLLEVTDREIGSFGPSSDKLFGAVGRSVVNYHPFEVAERLRAQTFVHAMNGMRPIVGRRENCEERGLQRADFRSRTA